MGREQTDKRKRIIQAFVTLILLIAAVMAAAGQGEGGRRISGEPQEASALPAAGRTGTAAAGEDYACGTLIQTTTYEEEYEGLLKLNLLWTRQPGRQDMEQAIANVRPSLVRLQAGRFYGSGCILDMTGEDILIVSNKHVLENWDNAALVTFSGGKTTGGALLGLSPSYDVGFVSVPVSALGWEQAAVLRQVRAKQPAYEALEQGSAIFSVGAAGNQSERMDSYVGEVVNPWWYIEEFNSNMIYCRGYGHPGMSGGGTFDACGNYVGMLTGGTGNNETASLPLPVIMQEYESLTGHKAEDTLNAPSGSTSDSCRR